jgi:hypothetical protein
MTPEFFLAQAIKIVDIAAEMFPDAFEKIGQEKRGSLVSLVGDTLRLCFQWLVPSKRAYAGLNIRRNMNQVEWIVIGGLRDEEANNMKRVFSGIAKIAGVGAAMITVLIPDFSFAGLFGGDDETKS